MAPKHQGCHVGPHPPQGVLTCWGCPAWGIYEALLYWDWTMECYYPTAIRMGKLSHILATISLSIPLHSTEDGKYSVLQPVGKPS